MTKAQMIGQIFIYILTIVVFGIILLYGYNAIKSMNSKADQVLLIQLKKQIADAVQKTDYGSVTQQNLLLPNEFNELCFVDLGKSANNDLNDEQPLVYDSWKDNVHVNMFLIKDKTDVDSDYIGSIKLIDSSGYFCTKAFQGKVSLRLEGKGKYVELSAW